MLIHKIKTFGGLIKLIGTTTLNTLYDFGRYILFTQPYFNQKYVLRRNIIIRYHSIEKGLTLRPKKPWFGQKNIQELINFINIYFEIIGYDEISYLGYKAVQKYFYEQRKYPTQNGQLKKNIEIWLKQHKGMPIFNQTSGIELIKREDIIKDGAINRNFFYSRHSIRHFSRELVSNSIIEEAVDISKKTPSVCNRQNTRIHVYSDKLQIKNILSYQSGNRGFGHEINKLIIISYVIHGFQGGDERNQGWIDAGMRAMSLIYALHSIGLGTCCLNWSVSALKDIKVRKLTNIALSETIVMMIAVGHIPKGGIKVTLSPSLRINDILKCH